MESVLRTLREAGFSADMTHHAYHALDSHITGFTLWQVSMPFETKEELVELAEGFLRRSRRRVPLHHRARRTAHRPVQPEREDRVRVRARPDPRRPRAAAGSRTRCARRESRCVPGAGPGGCGCASCTVPGETRARNEPPRSTCSLCPSLGGRVLRRRPFPDVSGHAVERASGACAVRVESTDEAWSIRA